jgi:tetratricopeptide (TPR) repeat protein/WD40 repeat protein
MGTVYMAEQTEPVKRLVALKVIRDGMDSRQVLARFEAERQALALMDHPNIAKVLDAGATVRGWPYFVMELVKGVPLTTFCDERRLTPRERLALFVPVCQAVQHAHQKGVIHRDIKPGNVLVALYDGHPVPKVIDFGVAKATGSKLTEATLYTGFNAVVGTPEYMSPEQAELNQLDIDTRSDIYSLGVLLYELLTGSTPLQNRRVREAAVLEVLRLIREEEPPRPSRRLSTTEELASIAANRSMEPRKLTSQVHGDLDWIVMKALEKDRNRRYETANGFAVDVQRFLRDEPVSARPPSTWYRVSKLARRRRVEFVAGVALLMTLVSGIVGTTWGMIRADAARAEAQAEAGRKALALRAEHAALAAARLSQRDADEKLFASYRDQARASRLTRRPGQRFDSLDALRRALELARALQLPGDVFDELRDDVIASLALPDLDVDPSGSALPWPDDALAADFDATLTTYARTDRGGSCSVRRVSDDVELHRIPGAGTAAKPRMSGDGRFLAITYYTDAMPARDFDVHVWDLGRGPARPVLRRGSGRVVAFHPSLPQVGIGDEDGTVRVYELPSGRLIFDLPAVDGALQFDLAMHPTEPLIAECCYFQKLVRIRDLVTGETLARFPQETSPSGLAWRPDGRVLAVGATTTRRIRLYDRTSLKLIRTLAAGRKITELAFNHAGDRLASMGWDDGIEIHDANTGETLLGDGCRPQVLRFDRDDQRLAAVVRDDRLVTLRVADGRESRRLHLSTMPPDCEFTDSVSVSPEGRLLAAATDDGFGLWDANTGVELAFIPTGRGHNRVLFESSGAILVLCKTGLWRWPVRQGVPDPGSVTLGPPSRPGLPPGFEIAQSDNGRITVMSHPYVLNVEEDRSGAWILNSERPGEPMRVDPGADTRAIGVSPDGNWMVTVAQGATITTKVWDTRSGELVKRLEGGRIATPHFSRDGRWLSIEAGDARVLEVGTWRPGPSVGGVGRFAPDGRTLVSANGSGGLRIVELASGRTLATLTHPHDPFVSVPDVSPDGGLVVARAVGGAGGLRVWDLRLLRRRLAEMGLDWDATAIVPAAGNTSGSLSIEVQAGQSHYNTGVTLAAERRLEEAAAELRKAIEADPGNAAAYDDLGSVLCDLKRPDEAIEHYRRSIELDPNRATAHNNLGYLLLLRGHRVEAITCFRRAVDLQPGYARAHGNLGYALSAHGLIDEAIAAYRRVAELDPGNAHYANLLAWLLVTTGPPGSRDPAEALRQAARAVELEPANGNYWNTLGVARYRAGEWGSAAEALEKARALRGDAQLAQDGYFLAMCHHRLGHDEEARAWFVRAVDWAERNAPRDEELKRFRAEAEKVIGRGPEGEGPG